MKLGTQTPQCDAPAWPVGWVDDHGKPQGVALVATLIMLSLVTFMTVAFLGVARRERRSMEAHLNQGDANNAMYAALNAAQTELVSRMLSPNGKGDSPDPYSYTLFGSTNYLNPAGFSIGLNDEANVNDYQAVQFIYDLNGAHTNWLEHLSNLKILPRVPVFNRGYTNGYTATFTNNNGSNSVEGRFGRFYLDFNRNGHYEPTFSLGHEQGSYSGGGHANWFSNLTVSAFGGGYLTGYYAGDPHWIGILADPSQPHGPSNQFIGRYSFLVLPAGKSLDLNNIHNQHKVNNTNRSSTYVSNGFTLPHTLFDGFTRNAGAGSWEINLAAFLAGLNTNNYGVDSWVYDDLNYTPGLANPVPFVNGDTVFQDAADLIRHRYNTNFQELTNIVGTVGANEAVHLAASGADLMGEFYPHDFDRTLSTSFLDRDGMLAYHYNTLDNNGRLYHWAGATNIDIGGGGNNEYKTIEELFRQRQFYQSFLTRLTTMSASTDPAAYVPAQVTDEMRALDDRYTFYRLLSQMGTESEAPQGKVNLNFDNTAIGGGYAYPDDSGRLVNGTYAGWRTAVHFFTNVAQALIDASITTNVVYRQATNGQIGAGRYITNYTLGSLLEGDNTNRYTIIGGETRSLANNQWVRETRSIYYASNFVGDSTLSLTNITVFPYNQFTPTLHRLLQVAANLHETAGNSREWRTNQTYTNLSLVRRYGRYYKASGASTGVDPTGGNGSWVLSDPGLPHVFRPVFRVNANFTPPSIYISEWLEVTNAYFTNITYLDFGIDTNRTELLAVQNGASTIYPPPFTNSDFMMQGFPLIIGAKGPTRNTFSTAQEVVGAGIPNFNEISFKTLFSVTRKLRLTETNKNDALNPVVDSQYIISLRLGMGVEAWNPYRYHSYPRDLEIQAVNRVFVSLVNDVGTVYTNTLIFANSTFVPGGTWEPSGFVTRAGNSAAALGHNSFRTILGEYRTVIPESVYYPPAYSVLAGIPPEGYLDTNWFLANTTNSFNSIFAGTNIHPDLDLKLVISNWFTYTAIDTSFPDGRIVDHVNLTNLSGEIDLVDALVRQTNQSSGGLNLVSRYFDPRRATNFFLVSGVYITNGMPLGVINQLRTSMDLNWRTNRSVWRAFNPAEPNQGGAVTNTRRIYGVANTTRNAFTNFAGFNPTVVMEQDLVYEVNDPLVHYLTSQLVTADRETQSSNATPNLQALVLTNYSDTDLWFNPPIGIGPPGNIGRLNGSYRPWGGNPAKGITGSKQMSEHFNMGIKDPAVYFADDWDFPERKFGSIGWMGRVHRGTPWQTIYMKSRVASHGEWAAWGADATGSRFEYPITFKGITNGVATLRTSRAHRFSPRQEVTVDIGDVQFDGSRRVVELDGNSFTIEFYLSEVDLATTAVSPTGSVSPLAQYLMDMHPTNDWRLFDGVTAHLSRKAAKGLLGINQTNFAAWSAVLGGLAVMTNTAMYPAAQTAPDSGIWYHSPTNFQAHRIHTGILQSRRDLNSFAKLGDILAVPELSCASPYLSMERSPYYHLRTYTQGQEVSYRGIRWRARFASGVAIGEYPPSMRQHQIPEYNYASFTNLVGVDNPVEFGTYLWYRDSSINRYLVRATATTFNVPVTSGVLNPGWQQSRWEEQQQNVLQTEAYGFSENMIERIPQKIMGLLKRDPHPRVVVYAFGQALAPADQGRYLFPGEFQGMVTNYQVIGEVSSRTVLRVEGIPEAGLIPFHTNAAAAVFPRVVVEDHKLLGRQ